MNNMLWLPEALEDVGVNVKTLTGWEQPHVKTDSNGNPYDYLWRNDLPDGAMWHHTATNGYSPNRLKGNAFAGLGVWHDDRLYATGGGEPFYVIANAYPAPISSGYGVQSTLTDYVQQDIKFVGKQTLPDDSPRWAGNRSYWNTEVVLDGIGTWIDEEVWAMMVRVATVLSQGLAWSENRHIGHGQHTVRKIDLRDGRFDDMATTMAVFQDDVRKEIDVECPWTNTDREQNGIEWLTDYPPCDEHYSIGTLIQWGVNTGVCNVPVWGEDAVKDGVASGYIKPSDNNRDDFDRPLTDGRYWVFEHRKN